MLPNYTQVSSFLASPLYHFREQTDPATFYAQLHFHTRSARSISCSIAWRVRNCDAFTFVSCAG
jgi:hypothetical protein